MKQNILRQREVFPKGGSPREDLLSLKTVENAALFYAVAGFFITLLFYGDHYPIVAGFLCGAVIGIFNFRLLRNVVQRLLDEKQATELRSGFLFIFKIVALLVLTGLLILGAKVNALSFAMGFMAVIFGISYEAFRSLLKG